PPHRSTTFLPRTYAATAAPISPRTAKLRWNSARTSSKPGATCPPTAAGAGRDPAFTTDGGCMVASSPRSKASGVPVLVQCLAELDGRARAEAAIDEGDRNRAHLATVLNLVPPDTEGQRFRCRCKPRRNAELDDLIGVRCVARRVVPVEAVDRPVGAV